MAKRRSLKFVETEGGPFILLPKELQKASSARSNRATSRTGSPSGGGSGG